MKFLASLVVATILVVTWFVTGLIAHYTPWYLDLVLYILFFTTLIYITIKAGSK